MIPTCKPSNSGLPELAFEAMVPTLPAPTEAGKPALQVHVRIKSKYTFRVTNPPAPNPPTFNQATFSHRAFTRKACTSPEVPCSASEVVARQLPSVLGPREGLWEGCTAVAKRARMVWGVQGLTRLLVFGRTDLDCRFEV